MEAIIIIIIIVIILSIAVMLSEVRPGRRRRLMAIVESMSSCQMADLGNGKHDYACDLNVVYQAAGQTHRTKLMYRGPRSYTVGQTIELEISPSDPTDVRPVTKSIA